MELTIYSAHYTITNNAYMYTSTYIDYLHDFGGM